MVTIALSARYIRAFARRKSRAGTQQKGRRAAAAADKYDRSTALARYRQVILGVANSHRRSE